MTSHRTASVAALFALAAVSAPYISQAQDPATLYKQASAAMKQRNYPDALKILDKAINAYANPKSRVAEQFGKQLGVFYYQKGMCLLKIPGENGTPNYEAAKEAFNICHTKKEYADRNVNQFRNLSLFQMAECELKMAAQDPTHYEKAIEHYTKFLNYYSNKSHLTKFEADQALTGNLYIRLAQCNLMKPEHDFKATIANLKKATAFRSTVTDKLLLDTAMNLVKVAISPDVNQPSLAYDTINSSRESFNLGDLRIAVQAGEFLNLGFNCYNKGREALADGQQSLGMDYFRLAETLLGLLPETDLLREELNDLRKRLGSVTTVNLSDGTMVFTGQKLNKLQEYYDNVAKNHLNLEANAILANANMMINLGSNRSAKAAYQLLEDRYHNFQRSAGNDQYVSLREDNLYQLAMTMRASGDIEGAQKVEVKHRSLYPDSKFFSSLAVNYLAQLVKEGRYDEALQQAREVLAANAEDTAGETYITAAYVEAAALFKLNNWEELLPSAENFLSKQPDNEKYSSQVLFYLINAQNELKQVQNCINSCELYLKKYPDVDSDRNMPLPHVYYTLITNLMNHGAEGDREKAMTNIDKVIELFPDHELCPVVYLQKASILIVGETPEEQIQALDAFKKAYELTKDKPKLKQIKANALYCLASYTPDIEVPDTDEESRLAEANAYIKSYWDSADYEGNPYSLQMATLEMNRALDDKALDKTSFDNILKRLQDLIVREANYSFEKNKINPELEAAVNSYTQGYIDGAKKYGNELTLDAIRKHFYNFPGINQNDKYTNAILRMAMINQLTNAMRALPRTSKDPEELAAANKKRTELAGNVEQVFREMVNSFAPKDLTEFINVQVGNYLTEYVQRFEDTASKEEERREAITYYDEAIKKHGQFNDEATFGKAKALGLSADDADLQKSIDILQKLLESPNADVSQNAMVEMTRIYMKQKNYAKAVETASSYISNKRNVRDRLPMLMLLGEAYAGSGDIKNALLTYMNLYNQNIGRIQYSAPACEAVMKLYWQRNNPKTDKMASDRWMAWNMGVKYLEMTKANEPKFSPDERDKWSAVRALTAQYQSDQAVAAEQKARVERRAQLQKNK